MISFRHVTQTFTSALSKKTILKDLTIDLPTDRRLGILGSESSGKTTLMRLIAGFDKPTSGTIERYAHVSFPIAYEGVFKRQLSPIDNIRQFAHVFGNRVDSIVEFIRSTTGLDENLALPLYKLSPENQRRFVVTAGYALPFDCYLIDERFACGPSDEAFKSKCVAMLQARAAKTGIIFASARPQILQRFCEMAAVLENGKLTLYEDVNRAVEAYNATLARRIASSARKPVAGAS